METVNVESSSERSNPVEGGTVLKGWDVLGDHMGICIEHGCIWCSGKGEQIR